MAHYIQEAQNCRFSRLDLQAGLNQFFMLDVVQVTAMCKALLKPEELAGKVAMSVGTAPGSDRQIECTDDCDDAGQRARYPGRIF